jgi:penicillin-binding protein 1A
MGRDDARPVGGLQGGRAPASAFAAFMKTAVAKRPVEEFETQVTLPEWQLEPDEEAYFGNPEQSFVDENGMPIEPPPTEGDPYPSQEEAPAPAPAPQTLDQQWLDGVLGKGGRR